MIGKPTRIKRKNKRRKKGELTKLKEKLEALQKGRVIELYGSDCYTCPKQNLQGSNRHLGHGPWNRSELSQECLFSTDYTRIQCFDCNIHKRGRHYTFAENLKRDGVDIDALKARNLATKGLQYPKQWYLDRIAEFEQSTPRT